MDDSPAGGGLHEPRTYAPAKQRGCHQVTRNRAIRWRPREADQPTLVAGAYRVQLVNDQLVWQDLRVSSRHHQQDASIGLKLMTVDRAVSEEMLQRLFGMPWPRATHLCLG
jgi:hypothetical protein